MAKKSIIAREHKRTQLVNRYRSLRKKLKATFINPNTPDDERWAAETRLQKLSPNSSPVRQRARCRMCGRPTGVYKKFGLCRIHLREAAMRGDVPGLVKSSW